MEWKEVFQQLKRRNVFRVAGVYAVAGWVLIQIAATTFPFFGIPDWGVRFVVGLVLLGFPISLILAWAFELTPDGVKRTDEVPVEKSITRKTGHKLNIILGISLALAIGFIFYQQLPGPKSEPTSISLSKLKNADSLSITAKSIAVLPFINDSRDSSDQYFSDGLSEELIIALNQYPGLKVIGRESSFRFRGRNLDSKEIGQKLGVAHLLEGSVSREGHEVRVRTELVNTSDGSMVWSHHYDRAYRNLFALQDDLTHAVASVLKAKLMGSGKPGAAVQTDRPPSGNLKAYNAYLQGNFYFNRFNEQGMRRAIGYYQQAIRIDKKYAAAYAKLSVTWVTLESAFGGAKQAYAKARAAADTALRIDPNLAAAHLAHGTLLQYTLDWRGAEVEYHRALALDPSSPDAKQWLAFSLASLGRIDEAVRLARSGIAANPLDAESYRFLARYLWELGQLDAAKQAAERALSLQPAAGSFHAWLAAIDVQRGDIGAALQAAQAEQSPLWRNFALAITYSAASETKQADTALHIMISRYAEGAAYQIAEIYAFQRKPKRIFTWLDRAWKQRDPGIGLLYISPLLLRYRDDPRFAAFCKKVGLPPPDSTDAVSYSSDNGTAP